MFPVKVEDGMTPCCEAIDEVVTGFIPGPLNEWLREMCGSCPPSPSELSPLAEDEEVM